MGLFSHGVWPLLLVWVLAHPFLGSVARPSQGEGAPLLPGMSMCLVECKRLLHRCCRAQAMLQETTRKSTRPLVDHKHCSIQRSSFALALGFFEFGRHVLSGGT